MPHDNTGAYGMSTLVKDKPWRQKLYWLIPDPRRDGA